LMHGWLFPCRVGKILVSVLFFTCAIVLVYGT